LKAGSEDAFYDLLDGVHGRIVDDLGVQLGLGGDGTGTVRVAFVSGRAVLLVLEAR